MKWLQLEEQKRIATINQVSNTIGFPAQAVEKDWWVTLALRALFSTKYAHYMAFKGGTSLSKSWNLISRFSEDIDIALDRKVLGFDGELSNSQIRTLRKKSCEFVSTELLKHLGMALVGLGVPEDQFQLIAQEVKSSDKDPQTIELRYKSLFSGERYLLEPVKIEVSPRSLMEPIEERKIESLIDAEFGDQDFVEKPFLVATVLPKRTFLEKAFLLHEEFSKPAEKMRGERKSRHLYDLERLMDTEHGAEAMKDSKLFKLIGIHRAKFSPVEGVNYSEITLSALNFLPPDNVISEWRKDYQVMSDILIPGDAISFEKLMERMYELKKRFEKK